eukprot:CAMPEP_0171904570 /NCGR_PEP_ID=MMETSP0993-20121228/4213_1 /TAXON_ID=483369 /ORGANISM="non described non described, Strain CCMP2098" /LENGTH=219 /DNA_ID=CAMNT_0012535525 /DNA_START=23 /DNA_END=682 /DNA_ORIENTATION=+
MAAKRIIIAARPAARSFSSAPSVAGPENLLKHRSSMPAEGKYPLIGPDVFVAPSATVVGDVELFDGCSVWYNAVIRADQAKVQVGFESVIGERVTITTAASLESGFPADVRIEQWVTVGAGSALRSCIVEYMASIGENCVIGEGAVIEEGAEVGAGSVVPPGRLVPAGEHWAGNPVAYVGKARSNVALRKEQGFIAHDHYMEFLPNNTVFWAATEKPTA